jgi:hypothetical protein
VIVQMFSFQHFDGQLEVELQNNRLVVTRAVDENGATVPVDQDYAREFMAFTEKETDIRVVLGILSTYFSRVSWDLVDEGMPWDAALVKGQRIGSGPSASWDRIPAAEYHEFGRGPH